MASPKRDWSELSDVDPKAVHFVMNSLRDRIYQRSFNLRKTFRELDGDGNGLITIPQFIGEMTRSYSLSPLEQRCLKVLLNDADIDKDGNINFREFCEMLKMRDHEADAGLSASQKKHMLGRGVMDPRMQRMVMSDGDLIKVEGGLPTNELGAMRIDNCPFAVLGDSERMGSVTVAFVSHKMDSLRKTLREFDSDNDGFLTFAEFRAGMKEVDKYVFDAEIDSLVEALNGKKGPGTKKHLVNIEDFVTGMGKEYLKKKAHRSAAHQNPFVWEVKPAGGKSPRGDGMGHQGSMAYWEAEQAGKPREDPKLYGVPMPPPGSRYEKDNTKDAAKPSPRKLKPGQTRGQLLRTQECKAKLADMSARRREDAYYDEAVRARKAGVPMLPGALPSSGLPAIASARGSARVQ